MGSRGPIGRSAEAQKRLGNPSKRPLSGAKLAIPATTEVPTPPKSLGRAGRAVWRRLWEGGRGWLDPVTDLDGLTRLCEHADERLEIMAVLERDGRFTTGSKGQTVAHPAVQMLRALEASMGKLEGAYGFSPSDRARLGLAEVKIASAPSKLDELMARRREHQQTVARMIAHRVDDEGGT